MNDVAGVTLGTKVQERVDLRWIVAAAVAPAVAYLALGPGWIREDWGFVATRGNIGPGWFGLFRPLAWPFHVLLFAPGSPVVALVVQTGFVVLAAVLFAKVVEKFTGNPALGQAAGLVWAALPIHSAMSFWASGAYITAAACAALQSLRDDSRRGAWWVVVAGCLYEASVVPVVLIAVVRRQWWHAAAGATAIVWSTAWSPMTRSNVLVDPRDVLAGTFGLGVSALLGVAVVVALWLRGGRAVAVGFAVAATGVVMFLPYGQDIDFDGIGDRANVVAAFGVALALAAVARRYVRHLVAVLLALSFVTALDYSARADAELTSTDCKHPPALDWTNEPRYEVLCG